MSSPTTIPITTTGATKKATISKMLVAIDGSDASMDAAAHAIPISKKYNAELYALHVIRADVDLFGQHETSEFMTRMRSEGEKYLNKVKFNANEKNIQIKTEIHIFITFGMDGVESKFFLNKRHSYILFSLYLT